MQVDKTIGKPFVKAGHGMPGPVTIQRARPMIDLHSHTTESDGTFPPGDLLRHAEAVGLQALAITDHDTFSGYDQAAQVKNGALELICGIELSTRFKNRSVHLLAYFIKNAPAESFRIWIAGLQAGRHLRNQELVARLQSAGVDITLEEIAQRGKKLPGRPHFAALLVEKKYATSLQNAFDQYLGEGARCYVPRDEPSFGEAVSRIRAARGVSSLAHPVRISRDPGVVEQFVHEVCDAGLQAIEIYHSDHSPAEVSLYTALANKFSLAVTGGSDFHGGNKPHIALGTGHRGNVHIERSVLEQLRCLN